MSRTNTFKAPNNVRPVLISCGLIAIITFIVFIPSLQNDFTNWDDDYYVVNNPDIKAFTVHNLAKIFTTNYVANYQPLTLLTYMIEYQIFKLNPGPYHFENLLLHIINCLLVFALIYGFSGKKLTSLVVAILFAIHPLRVESVAWISERKDLLAALFYFLSLISYVHYLDKGKRKFYYLCGLSLLFSLLSKPMAVSLPFILLIINYLRSGRLNKKAVIETIPIIAIAAVFVAITLFTQDVKEPVLENCLFSKLQWFCVPFYGIVFYIVKLIIPTQLCALYAYPVNPSNALNIMLISSPFIVIGLAASVYFFRTYSRKMVFGALFFLITALPILQIVRTGNAMVADHYTYIPLLGCYFIFAVFFRYLLLEKYKTNRLVTIFLVACLTISIIIFSYISMERCSVWKNSITLWNDVIDKHPVTIAFSNRAAAYGLQGDYDHAIEDLNQAIALNPAYSVTYFNRGSAYKAKGNYKEAIEDFSQVIKINPQDYDAYYRRAVAYYYEGLLDLSIKDFTQTIDLNPNYAEAYFNRGIAFKGKGDYGLFMVDIKKACSMGFEPACNSN